MHVVIGSAGHIDHGKTALIKALTGTDADRLPEEKRRGITVDLGFAEMAVGDLHFDFVDVPGHERFVKNMLAGASGIDIVMLVIAADEGVMPQTREHFDICRLLGMTSGVVVLTKTDLADKDVLELARLEAAELVAGSFLESAPVVCVSSRTGEGVDELKQQLDRIARGLPARSDELVTRLPVDRSFSVKGFGAVVTGTLASGSIAESDELVILPNLHTVRVRGLQTHGQTVTAVNAGQRTAVNLGGITHTEISRGMLLAQAGVLHTTQMIDAEVEVLPGAARPLRSRQRVRFHIGTIEVLARAHVLNESGEVCKGEKGLVQFRLEAPVAAIALERFIIRSYSPQMTIAGGRVIDAFAAKHRRKDFAGARQHLKALINASSNDEKVRVLLAAAGFSGLSFADLQARTALRKPPLKAAIDANIVTGSVVTAGSRYLLEREFDTLRTLTISALNDFHSREPLARGMSREQLADRAAKRLPADVFLFVLSSLQSSGIIAADGDTIRLAAHRAQLSPEGTELRERIKNIFRTGKLEVPKLDEALGRSIEGTRMAHSDARKFLQLLLDSGDVVKVTDEFYFAGSVIDELIADLKFFADTSTDRLIDVAQFKEMAGISRKYAIPLLEYFDRRRITVRSGDKRLILK